MSDELVWSEGQLLGGANTHHAITQRNRYDIVEMKPRRSCGGSWHTARTDHALMPPFNGYCFTLESAKRACEHDFIALARADRWLDYMRDNEPPLQNIPPGPCGEPLTSAITGRYHSCELLAGHAGQHVDGDTCWTIRTEGSA